MAAGSLGVSAVGTSNLAAGAASAGAGAYSAATYEVPSFDTWETVQSVVVAVPAGATGVAIAYSLYLSDPGLTDDTVGGGGSGGGNGAGA